MGLAWLDISSGRFAALEFSEPSQLTGELERLRPAELLVPETLSVDNIDGDQVATPTRRPDWSFDIKTGRKKLLEKFGTRDLQGFGCEDLSTALGAAACLLEYCQDKHRNELPHIKSLRRERSDDFIRLDSTTRRNLDIAEVEKHSQAISLLTVLDSTATVMGGRLLKRWLNTPLRCHETLAARHQAVDSLVNKLQLPALRDALAGVAKGDIGQVVAPAVLFGHLRDGPDRPS